MGWVPCSGRPGPEALCPVLSALVIKIWALVVRRATSGFPSPTWALRDRQYIGAGDRLSHPGPLVPAVYQTHCFGCPNLTCA